jgi:hypothetical protein
MTGLECDIESRGAGKLLTYVRKSTNHPRTKLYIHTPEPVFPQGLDN